MASVIWTKEALQDIDNIAIFISRDSEWYAKQFISKLFAETEKLERYPEVGKSLRELPQSSYKEFFLRNIVLFIASMHYMCTL